MRGKRPKGLNGHLSIIKSSKKDRKEWEKNPCKVEFWLYVGYDKF